MTTAGYEAFSLTPSAVSCGYRNLPERLMSYELPSGPPRRKSPSPVRRYFSYDSYIPPRADRGDFQNDHRPKVWRPPRSYYSRSPTPDRYGPSRVPDSDTWNRYVPPSSFPSTSRLDRTPPRASNSRSRERAGRDTLATPMFEPSDMWKQTHTDRLGNPEESGSLTVRRYPERRTRDSRERSLDSRPGRSPPRYSGADCYRPHTASHSYRGPFPFPRADCYRPRYDDDTSATRTQETSGTVETHGRDSRSHLAHSPPGYGRQLSSQATPRSISSRSRSRTPGFRSRTSFSYREISRERRSVSEHHSHDSSMKAGRRMSTDLDERPLKRIKLRSPSRSSIASSRASDNQPLIEHGPLNQSQGSYSTSIDPTSSFSALIEDNKVALNGSESKPQLTSRGQESDVAPMKGAPSDFSADRSETPLENTARKSSNRPVSSAAAESQKRQASREFLDKRSEAAMLRRRDNSQADDLFSNVPTNTPERRVKLDYSDLSTWPPPDIPDEYNPEDYCSRPQNSPGLLKLPTPPPPHVPDESKASIPLYNPPPSAGSPLEKRDGSETPSLNDRPADPPLLNLPYERIISQNEPDSTEDQILSLSPKSTVDVKMDIDLSPVVNNSLVQPPPSPVVMAVDECSPPPSRHGEAPPSAPKDGPLQNILPNMSDAKSITDALLVVVITRSFCDDQTREDLVNPVLMANLSLAEGKTVGPPAADELVGEVMGGTRLETRTKSFAALKETLVTRFDDRRSLLVAKTKRLREEYRVLHERWLAHCARLDGSSKPGVPEEAVPNPGRTTRRSAATLGDAVRSDLEMEQIIASLGNDDLTDPNHLAARNVAVIPDMISVVHGQVDCVYDDTNNLVEDPGRFYAPYTGIHDWTDEEKEIFLDKFAAFPKQFGVIAEFLPNKTAAQCVDYYYLHKKTLIDFRKVVSQLAPNKRRRGTRRDRQKGNGLLADIRRHDDEVHRDSASPLLNGPTTRRRRVLPILTSDARKPGPSRRNASHLEATPVSTPTPEPETRPSKRRPTGTFILVKGCEDVKDSEPRISRKGRRNRKGKPGATPTSIEEPIGETKFIDHNSYLAIRRKNAAVNVQWSDVDKAIFLGLLAQYGDDFKRIAASMPNKTTIQVSNFYKTNLVELKLGEVAASAPKRSPTPEMSSGTSKDVPHASAILPSGTTPSVDGSRAASSLKSGRLPDGGPSRRLQLHDLLSSSGGPTLLKAPWLPSPSTEESPMSRLESTGQRTQPHPSPHST